MAASNYDNFYLYLTQKAQVRDKDFEALLPYFEIKNYRKGEQILVKGAISKQINFVEKGLLMMYTLDEHGKEHILQFAPENWWLSDRNNLCSEEPSEYYIEAYEESRVVVLNQTFIQHATAISPEFRTFHEHLLQHHIKQLYHRIKLLISATAKTSYLEFIKTYPDITQRVPQWMIASYMGITPEAVSRIRKELASE